MYFMEFIGQTPNLLALIQQKNILKAYYKKLCTSAPDQKTFEILQQIIKDENRHYNSICNLYRKIAGIDLEEQKSSEIDLNSFSDVLEKVIKEEINALEHYKNMYMVFKKSELKDEIFEIILDEIKHSMQLNLIRHEVK